MRCALLLLAACAAKPQAIVSKTAPVPPGMAIVIGDNKGVGLFDLQGLRIAQWSTREGTVIGALPDHSGVVVLSSQGKIRIVAPTGERDVGEMPMQMACGNEGAASLGVKIARVTADGRAACVEMTAITTGEIQVEATIDLASGAAYLHRVGSGADCRVHEQPPPAGLRCEPRMKPLVKSVEIEGETFRLAGISPKKRWEIYEGPRTHDSSIETAKILVIDTLAKQRYALETGDWPAVLQPGHKVSGAWAANPQVTWLGDDILAIDQYVLVELGKRVSLPGSFIRW